MTNKLFIEDIEKMEGICREMSKAYKSVLKEYGEQEDSVTFLGVSFSLCYAKAVAALMHEVPKNSRDEAIQLALRSIEVGIRIALSDLDDEETPDGAAVNH